jgi:hypothetical protein
MGDENKKSFWTSLPGILTGVAAVIAAVTGIVAAYNHAAPSTPPIPPSSPNTAPTTPPSPTTPPQPSSPSPQTQKQSACGVQFPGLELFGSWRWSGTVHDTSESGVLTLSKDCTFTDVPISGFTGKGEGQFLVGSSPASITFTNKDSGEKHTYLISHISENAFHASNPNLTVNLDYFRAS